MIVLNLTSGFEPFGSGASFTNAMFPSNCELNIRIPGSAFVYQTEENIGPLFNGRVVVTARVSSSDDIMRIMLAADALNRLKEVKETVLFIPYLPYARQDHIVAPGEALSLSVMAKMINMCGFDEVIVFDPHSDVAVALIENITVHSNLKLVKIALEGKSNYWLASPDAGAYKKVGKLADQIGYNRQIIACGKVRDPRPGNNGKILGMSVPQIDLQGQDVYIIDDIVEGRMTEA
jgi:ribose-phosphate pyrophosphokinase